MQTQEHSSYSSLYTKKAVFVSTAFHLVFIFIFLFSSYFFSRSTLKPKVYTVNLVDLPIGGGTRAPVKDTQVQKKKSMVTKKAKIQKKAAMVLPSKKKELIKKKIVTKKEVMPAPEKSAETEEPKAAAKVAPAGEAISHGTISLDTSTFPYLYYLRILKNKIYENWNPPVNLENSSSDKKMTVIFFKVLKSGEIVNPSIEKSSGVTFYDQSALRAVISANPLPPLPDEFKEEFLEIHMGFRQSNKG